MTSENKPLQRKRPLLRLVVFSFFFLVLILLIAEITARVIDSRAKSLNARALSAGEGFMDQPWRWLKGFHLHPPGSAFSFTNEDGRTIQIQNDCHGLRNLEKRSSDGAVRRLLVLGDSFIEAVNTDYEETFCRALEKRIAEQRIQVTNAGVGGYSNQQSFLLLNHLFDRIRPDAVLLMVYLGNDLRDNYWTFPDTFAVETKNRVPETGFLKSRLLKFLFDPPEQALPQAAATPLQDYYYFEIESYRNKPAPFVEEAREKTGAILANFKQFCEARGVPFVVASIPSKSMVYEEFRQVSWFEHAWQSVEKALEVNRDPKGFSFDRPDRYIESACKDNDLPYCSLLSCFRSHRDEPLFHNIDLHWTAHGQALAATRIQEWLEQQKGFSTIPDDFEVLDNALKNGITLERAMLTQWNLVLELSIKEPISSHYKIFVHVYDKDRSEDKVRAIYDFYPSVSTRAMQPGRTYTCRTRFPQPLSNEGAVVEMGLFNEAEAGYPRLEDGQGRSAFSLYYPP